MTMMEKGPMKKATLAMCIVGLFPFVNMAVAQEKIDQVTLSLTTHHPGNIPRSLPARLIKEEIEKATDGSVEINIFYAEALARGREALTSVANRIADIGDVNPAYYPGQLPLHAGIMVYTQAPPTHAQKREVMERAYEAYPALPEEFEKYNQRVLFQYQPQPLALSSTVPVSSINDFKELNIRASSEVYLNMLGSLGAIPVSVPFTDSYMALQTGTIDGVYTNIDAISGQNMFEPAPYTFTSPELSLFLPFTFTINQDVWGSFSGETQENIMAAMEVVHERYAEAYDDEYQRQIDLFKEKGEELVFASAEDIETWQNLAIIEKLKADLAETAEAEGVADGGKFVSDIERFMVEAAQ